MNLIPDKCVEFDEVRKICIATENGKKYELNNVSGYKIRKIKVDKCFEELENQRKCDYLISMEEQKRAIFIELKGGGLADALKQLYNTIVYMSNEFIKYRVDARIVGSKSVPGFINIPDYKKLAGRVKPTGGTIEYRTNSFLSEEI